MELWDQLPAPLRTKMSYPHVPTMIATDPTEAIHSDLIVETLARYFDLVEVRPVGGAIAYGKDRPTVASTAPSVSLSL